MAFALVQQVNANTTASGTSFSTAAFSCTAGNHLFVHVRQQATSSIASVTDSAGNTYTAIVPVSSSQSAQSQWFYCLNANGSASNVVTLTDSVSASYRSIRVLEFSASNPVFEQSLTASNATGLSSVSSAAFNTAGAGLILAGVSSYNAETSINFGANYTGLANVFNYSKEGYRITSSALTGEVVTYAGETTTNRSLAVTTFTEGASGVSGSLSSTLAGASLSSSCTVINAGTFASTLAGVSMAASGTAGNSPDGTFASTLDGVSMSASGIVLIPGVLSSTLAGITMSAAGAVTNRGAFSATMDGVTMSATGMTSMNASGTLASTLDGLTMAAAGYVGTPPPMAEFFTRLPKNPRHYLPLS